MEKLLPVIGYRCIGIGYFFEASQSETKAIVSVNLGGVKTYQVVYPGQFMTCFLVFQNFDSDISSVGIDGCWQADSQRLLNEVMVEHFFRQGMLDVAEELCQVTVCHLREHETETREVLAVFKSSKP